MPDGGTDARTEGGSATALTCAPNALMCDDFERSTVKGAFTVQSGSVSISSTRSHSPTRSLSAIARMNTSSPYLDAALRLPPPSRDVNFRIAHLLWGKGCDWELSWTLYMNASEGLRMDGSFYDEAVSPSCGPVGSDGKLLLSPAEIYVPVWHHLIATMDVSGKTRRVRTSIDGKVVPEIQVTSNRSTVPTDTHLAVGIPCVNQNSGCFDWNGSDYEVLIDDVTVVPAP